MNKNLYIFPILIFLISGVICSQDLTDQIFRSTRVVNKHSVETLDARKLDFRITHKFGDIGGESGGWNNFFGFENATDVSFGLEYGLSDHFMIGIGRAKGSFILRQNVYGFAKAKLFDQSNSKHKFSFSLLGEATASTMKSSGPKGSLTNFDNQLHRLSYHVSMIAARKFSDRFSLQGDASWTFRTLVYPGDKNDLFSLGGAARFHLSKSIALLAEAKVPILSSNRKINERPDVVFYPHYGIAFEIDTHGGHIFQLNITNSTGILETDFIPYTTSDFSKGEFRFGFTISRLFNL